MHRMEERSDRILYAIVAEFIATGEPVGSRTLVKKTHIGLSAASVRNIMGDLTDLGYLTQPHVSAGRIPTDKGIRQYVNTILLLEPSPIDEQSAIEAHLKLAGLDLRDLFRQSSSVLADLSGQAGMVAAPRAQERTFKTIEFMKIAGDRILVVLVSTDGLVQNKMIFDEYDLRQETLEKYSRMLNDMLRDLDLRQAREKIEQELVAEKTRMDAMLSKALQLGYAILSHEARGEIFIEGKTNILKEPDFAQLEQLKALLITLEEKSKLLNILEKTLEAEGIQVLIGSEHGLEEIAGCSIVAYPIRAEGAVLGSLGVIGPKRMDYKKVVPLVHTTARVLTRVLRTSAENPY
ncbi:MAG: heat-inducible transcriptional repressor HrcA [Thermodesulfobacteriota bacterium]